MMKGSYRDNVYKHKIQDGKDIININDNLIYNYILF